MVNTSWKNEIEYPAHSCKHCGGYGWRVGFYTDAGGAPKYPFVCVGCGNRTQGFAKRKAVEESGIDVQQLHPSEIPYICEVCGAKGAQMHHWAPYHLFDSEADRWPVSYLCRACHSRWHAVVTPNANGTRKT